MFRRLAPVLLLVVSMACDAPSADSDGGGSGGGGVSSGGGQGSAGGGTAALGGGQGSVGGGSGGLGGGQGNSGGGSAGSDGGAPTFSLEFKQTCPALSACPGDPVGTWNYTGACFSLSGFDAGCPGVTYDFHGTASGTMEFTASSVRQNVSWAVGGTILVPKSCALLCRFATDGIRRMGLQTPGCSDQGAAHCNCPVSFDGGSQASSDAGASGTTFRLSDSTGATTTYEYCIQSSSLSFHQLPTTNQADSSVFSLKP